MCVENFRACARLWWRCAGMGRGHACMPGQECAICIQVSPLLHNLKTPLRTYSCRCDPSDVYSEAAHAQKHLWYSHPESVVFHLIFNYGYKVHLSRLDKKLISSIIFTAHRI